VEGGPLLPVKTEFYQSGLGLEALRLLSNLAGLAGKNDVSKELQTAFERQRPAFNQAFWSAEKKAFAFALDQQNRRVDQLSVLTTVPMWFGVTDEDKSEATIRQLAEPDHQADWGMRIISNRAPIYNGAGYHFGSVWPLFTGWASVGEYRYHQAFPAYANLRANALLALDGSLGHVAEVLSGDYYQPLSTNSPHQIWSAAMVISPILRGMLGIETDTQSHTLRFAPHAPADWKSFSITNVPMGTAAASIRYDRAPGTITIEVQRSGSGEAEVVLSPAISLRSSVTSVELNGKSLPFHVEATPSDQHVSMRFAAADGTNSVRIHLKNDFGVGFSNVLPALGSASEGLRVLSESWNPGRTQLTLSLAGVAGKSYELSVWNPSQIASVAGGKLNKGGPEQATVTVEFPKTDPASYSHQDLVFKFAAGK
jgi:hypothetical protein